MDNGEVPRHSFESMGGLPTKKSKLISFFLLLVVSSYFGKALDFSTSVILFSLSTSYKLNGEVTLLTF